MKSLLNASKYFLYARKSTDDEERQLLSIPAQIDELRDLAKKENLNVVDTFIESKTAKTLARLFICLIEIFCQILSSRLSGFKTPPRDFSCYQLLLVKANTMWIP